MKIFYVLLMLATVTNVQAQRMSVPDLFNMLEWAHFRIDTTLKKQGYILMQKELDSTTSIYQYSHLDRKEEAPTTVRSLAYMDVKAGGLKSRLITYRTYSQEEYVGIAGWLLENGYRSKDKYEFSDQQHTVYTNGKESIRVKVIHTKLEGGKSFTSYELELGK